MKKSGSSLAHLGVPKTTQVRILFSLYDEKTYLVYKRTEGGLEIDS